MTGPKISSCTIFMSSRQSVKTVGATKAPWARAPVSIR